MVPSKPSAPPFRALIIEDDDLQRDASIAAVRSCGAILARDAASGREAMAAIVAESMPFDVIICDLKLPGMDGLELLRRAGDTGCRSAFILASSFEPSVLRAAEEMARGYGLRVVGAVEKPVTARKLWPLILRLQAQDLAEVQERTDRMMPASEVRRGIEQRQLDVFVQPKVNLQTGAFAGVEALMRWRHPKRGLLNPATFIPVMEEEGLIAQATLMLVEATIFECVRWRKQGLAIPTSINLSAHLLSDTALPDRIGALLADVGLEPQLFTIEVTETATMTDVAQSLETLARFRMKGFGLSIDDYGTGFACMKQLTRIPFTEMKIDRIFVTGSAGQKVLTDLLETSLDLARRLALTSVAEGIETREDWQTLADLGCDLGQGYFIAPPMPLASLPDWHRQWSAEDRRVSPR